MIFSGPLGANFTPESVEVEYLLSGVWTETAYGLPVLLDDGWEWDEVRSTCTLRLRPSELVAWADTLRGAESVALSGSSLPLGPDQPLTGQSVEVVGFEVDGPADSTGALFDCTVKFRVVGLSDPTGATTTPITDALSSGEWYPTAGQGSAWTYLDGGNEASQVQPERLETKAYRRGLTPQAAADLVTAWRNLRGADLSWTLPAIGRPFGFETNLTVTVKIPELRLSMMGRRYWEAEMRVVARPLQLEIPAGYGMRYGLSYGTV